MNAITKKDNLHNKSWSFYTYEPSLQLIHKHKHQWIFKRDITAKFLDQNNLLTGNSELLKERLIQDVALHLRKITALLAYIFSMYFTVICFLVPVYSNFTSVSSSTVYVKFRQTTFSLIFSS